MSASKAKGRATDLTVNAAPEIDSLGGVVNSEANKTFQTPQLPTDRSNSLADLAARIRSYHAATVAALNTSVIHAMAAGDLLIEAKAKVPHGQWLPWLAENCIISERTAQLYTKLAKNRATIEKAMANPQSAVADLTLNEAAALCVLAGRLGKLIEFAKRTEASGDLEELVSLCVAEGIPVIHDENYDAFAGRSDAEIRDWHLFALCIGDVTGSHVEWLLQKSFQSVEDWLGPEGDKCRAQWFMKPIGDKFKTAWAKFQADYADKSLAEIGAEIQRNEADYKAEQREASP